MAIFDNIKNIPHSFRLKEEKEDFQIVIENINQDTVFKGTNLWVLVFAIFIASLGLNVNSTAVIIGAMLVSPLMGPIMGLGMGMAINDLALLKKAIFNYLLAAAVGLITSTLYFFISPLNEAHSEILARTSPNIYDVLIALFGGFAGILAVASRKKGNIIPGVAIATALMPPLCTAGYGLATLKFDFFFGALYLFIINTVFIALATLITARLLKFPFHHLPEKKDETKTQRIVWGIVLITILPSIYFGYDIVRQNNFTKKANKFIEFEAVFPNNYLLKKNIDANKYLITLTYGGELIEKKEIATLKSKLPKYGLDTSQLKIRQGFAYLKETKNNEQESQLSISLMEKEKEIELLKSQADSLEIQKKLSKQIFNELKVQYPTIQSCIVQQVFNNSDTAQKKVWISNIKSKVKIDSKEKKKIEDWLKVRINTTELIINFEK